MRRHSFCQSCSVDTVTRVHKNATVGSMSGLPRFAKNNALATNVWKTSALLVVSLRLSTTLNRLSLAGVVTLPVKQSHQIKKNATILLMHVPRPCWLECILEMKEGGGGRFQISKYEMFCSVSGPES